MVMHLSRRPATPLEAAKRCANSSLTYEALARSAHPTMDESSPFLRWLKELERHEKRAVTDFRAMAAAGTWPDIEPFCVEAVGRVVFERMQNGSDPFGEPTSDPCGTSVLLWSVFQGRRRFLRP
jgi:hypothetical protein